MAAWGLESSFEFPQGLARKAENTMWTARMPTARSSEPASELSSEPLVNYLANDRRVPAVVQSQLNTYSGSDPIWGFVALVGSELFTGEVAVGLDPRVRLFAVDGRIYFAEREDDAAVGARLVNCGAISMMQLARGVVQAGGHESLARLFQRDATIDRDAVELTIEVSTESLLATIANNPVGMPEVFPLRYHPAGIHNWLHPTPPVVGDVVDDTVVEDTAVEDTAVEDTAVDDVVEDTAVEDTAVDDVVDEVAVEPLSDPVPAELGAAKVSTPLAVPEWPRVDDEPDWAIPRDAIEVPQIVAKIAEPVIEQVVPQIVAPMVIAEPAVVAEPEVVARKVVAPEFARLELTPEAAGLPKLAALNSVSSFAPSAPQSAPQMAKGEPPPNGEKPDADGSPLPKLAAGPVSMKDLKMAAAASESWGNTSNNMAAVHIWEMVDDLFEDPHKDEIRVGGGAPEERSRGWLRKKT